MDEHQGLWIADSSTSSSLARSPSSGEPSQSAPACSQSTVARASLCPWQIRNEHGSASCSAASSVGHSASGTIFCARSEQGSYEARSIVSSESASETPRKVVYMSTSGDAQNSSNFSLSNEACVSWPSPQSAAPNAPPLPPPPPPLPDPCPFLLQRRPIAACSAHGWFTSTAVH